MSLTSVHVVVQVILLVVAATAGNPAPEQRSVYKRISECLHTGDSLLCLKEYALETLNDVVASDKTIAVTNYFDIVKDKEVRKDAAPGVTLDALPENRTVKSGMLDDMLADKMDQFLQSRSIKINLAPVFEGRRKKDKYGGMMLMGGLAMAGMMAQMAMGKIAMMAGAALMISKIALLMSSLIGLKKLISSSGSSEHVVVTAAAPQHDHGHGGYSSGGWQRSLDALNLAYSGFVPEQEQEHEPNDVLQKQQ